MHHVTLEEAFDILTINVGDKENFECFCVEFSTLYNSNLHFKMPRFDSQHSTFEPYDEALITFQETLDRLALDKRPHCDATCDGNGGGLTVEEASVRIALDTRRGRGNYVVDDTYVMYIGESTSKDSGVIISKNNENMYSVNTLPQFWHFVSSSCYVHKII